MTLKRQLQGQFQDSETHCIKGPGWPGSLHQGLATCPQPSVSKPQHPDPSEAAGPYGWTVPVVPPAHDRHNVLSSAGTGQSATVRPRQRPGSGDPHWLPCLFRQLQDSGDPQPSRWLMASSVGHRARIYPLRQPARPCSASCCGGPQLPHPRLCLNVTV